MPLSEYEQRVLEQMERQLRSDDPKLASALHGRPASPVRTWVLASIGGLAGLGLLVGGVASGLTFLGVLGFIVLFGSVLLAVTPRRREPADRGPAAPRPAARKEGLLSRFEQRWERRRDDQR